MLFHFLSHEYMTMLRTQKEMNKLLSQVMYATMYSMLIDALDSAHV